MRRKEGGVVFSALDTYSIIGGLQNFNRRIILALASSVNTSKVLLMRDSEDILPKLKNVTIRGYSACRICFIFALIKATRRENVLLVGHINLLPAAAIVKMFNLRLKLILFVHGDEVWNDPEFRNRRWYELYILKMFTLIASVSGYTADVMSREFRVSRKKFFIFPNAVDRQHGLPLGPSRDENILVVTRLAAHDQKKYVDSVIKAFALLSGRRPDARLEIVGDGVLRLALEELSRSLGISERVIFRGKVSDSELSLAYSRARLFVLPSNKEGFGIVFLEAWLRALPVICGSEGASREIISDGVDGFVADPLQIGNLAERIEELLSNHELARAMGQMGYQKVYSRYLDDHFCDNLVKILRECEDSRAKRV